MTAADQDASERVAWYSVSKPDAICSRACGMMGFMGAADLYVTITEPTFVARFLLDPYTDTEDTVANVDAFVELPDGSTWALTIFTVDEVRRLLRRGLETGEVADGSYFWVVDQLIVPEPGVPAMTTAIRELVRNGQITSVGIQCDDLDFGYPDDSEE